MKRLILFLFFNFLVINISCAQIKPLSSLAELAILKKISINYQTSSLLNKEKAYSLAKKFQLDTLKIFKDGTVKQLIKLNGLGMPMYLQTLNNIDAAATTRTHTLYENGGLGLNLSGSSEFLKDRLALWDGGYVLSTHQELTHRIVQKDNPKQVSDHATHVSGTLIASGINPLAKGMSFQAPNLLAYDFDFDLAEASEQAKNLILSNHSYGYLSGWIYNTSENHARWEWYGESGKTEDFKFGFYDEETASWDNMAYFAPYYLPVKAAGNNRSSNGPAIGSAYYEFDEKNGNFILVERRPVGISNNDSYDIIPTTNSGKNILTVGAVLPVKMGYQQPSDVKISGFSSWGPTDDGRIKPDIVADGIGILSSSSTSFNSYATKSGTSMACPNACGSLLLLQELYAKNNAEKFMLSSSLKGLAIHTADEAGENNGPDYIYGWGLLNMENAAKVILNNKKTALLKEDTLYNNQSLIKSFIASGNQPVKITLCWTDPAGEPSADGVINNRTPKLVNDLDVKLFSNNRAFLPWVLNPNLPESPAYQADNKIDNVEQLVDYHPIKGHEYTFTIKHKNTLKFGKQVYSLIITGIDGELKNAQLRNKLSFSCYPNPSNEVVNISLYSEKMNQLKINIYSTNGKKIYSVKQDIEGIFDTKIQTSNFYEGMYLIEVTLGSQKAQQKLLVKRN